MKLKALLLAALAIVSVTCFATDSPDPRSVPVTGDKLTVVWSDEYHMISLDASKPMTIINGVKTVTIVILYNKENLPEDKKDLSASSGLVDINCESHQFKLQTEYELNHDNQVIRAVPHLEGWRPMKRESVVGKLAERICTDTV